ncbi:CopL family metal-binding regulatory protein [Luteimonas marina]|uniref:CopL family metal-binding regulatory protein n=1 Tax=Luteimonas marina TaxID=488485 RepID=UPI001EE27319|nr:CopL family metal-binding regulatory protein [Luteimonas marina]
MNARAGRRRCGILPLPATSPEAAFVFPVLLRLLLCLCLLLDAVAPTVAATRMAMAMPGAGHAVPAATDADAADRRDHGAMADCHTPDDATPVREAPPVPDDGDCLQRCLDLCLQHGFAMLSAMTSLPSTGPASAPARAARAQVPALHAFPPLRPPIA